MFCADGPRTALATFSRSRQAPPLFPCAPPRAGDAPRFLMSCDASKFLRRALAARARVSHLTLQFNIYGLCRLPEPVPRWGARNIVVLSRVGIFICAPTQLKQKPTSS